MLVLLQYTENFSVAICSNPNPQVNLLPLPKMYMGAMVMFSLANEEYKLLRSTDIHLFLKCVQELFIEAPSQLKQRFSIGDPIIEMLQVLDPCVSCSKFLSLVPLASSFPNLVSQSKLQMLDSEWRRLTINPLPFDNEDMEPKEFWGRVSSITDGSGTLQFAILLEFMQNLLCLPHANVNVESVFSSVVSKQMEEIDCTQNLFVLF